MSTDNMVNYRLMINDTLAVLVLYNTELEHSESFISLSKNLENSGSKMDIVVYDNSPEAVYEKESGFENWNIHYIHDSSNPGVSKAYNEGFKIGKKLNKKWLLLLDQDTTFPEEALIKYFEAMDTFKNSVMFAPVLTVNNKIYSPSAYYLKRGFHLKSIKAGLSTIRNRTLLNSGMCISLAAFEKIGGFNEKVRLYFSDFNFIDRYRRHYTDFIVLDTICEHKMFTIENKNAESQSKRFMYFCEGARNSSDNSVDFCIYFSSAFLRAIKLSAKFKTFGFITVFFHNFIKNKGIKK
ncbi:MAG: glycosyltransferase [Candidatus Methanoperedens sp.]|nr:glycosyltransferase [Candidatus Methanoperedens sp.]